MPSSRAICAICFPPASLGPHSLVSTILGRGPLDFLFDECSPLSEYILYFHYHSKLGQSVSTSFQNTSLYFPSPRNSNNLIAIMDCNTETTCSHHIFELTKLCLPPFVISSERASSIHSLNNPPPIFSHLRAWFAMVWAERSVAPELTLPDWRLILRSVPDDRTGSLEFESVTIY